MKVGSHAAIYGTASPRFCACWGRAVAHQRRIHHSHCLPPAVTVGIQCARERRLCMMTGRRAEHGLRSGPVWLVCLSTMPTEGMPCEGSTALGPCQEEANCPQSITLRFAKDFSSCAHPESESISTLSTAHQSAERPASPLSTTPVWTLVLHWSALRCAALDLPLLLHQQPATSNQH